MRDTSQITMKYFAELAGVSPKLVRRYVAILRSPVADYGLFSAQEGLH